MPGYPGPKGDKGDAGQCPGVMLDPHQPSSEMCVLNREIIRLYDRQIQMLNELHEVKNQLRECQRSCQPSIGNANRSSPTTERSDDRLADCDCHPMGSVAPVCDPVTLQCPCRARWSGRKCDVNTFDTNES